jgi:YD repeat-containing protein
MISVGQALEGTGGLCDPADPQTYCDPVALLGNLVGTTKRITHAQSAIARKSLFTALGGEVYSASGPLPRSGPPVGEPPVPPVPPIPHLLNVYHFLHDALGSVIGVVDDDGILVERTTYDPYGKPFIEKWDATANEGAGDFVAGTEPTSGLPVSSVANPFGFTGHRYAAAVSRSPPIAIRAPAVRRDRPCRGLQESRRC